MKVKLTVTDNNAPSDKYPQWGFSVDFKDDKGSSYYAEYPNYKSCPFEFQNKKTYSFDCSMKERFGLLNSKSFKITRIKNVEQH